MKTLLTLVFLVVAGGGLARAQDEGVAPPPSRAREAVEHGQYLPSTQAAATGPTTAAVLAGYDGARRSATFGASADVVLFGPVSVRAGATLMPAPLAETGAARWQPNFGVRVQVLKQERQGLDAAVGVFYRKERFVQDEGEIQVAMMGGLRLGRVGLLANLGYGQDTEGDDRDGLVNLAALYTATPHLQLGVDGRLRFDLGSTDSRRAARGESSYDLTVGPVATVPFGSWAVIAQTGYAAVKTTRLQGGVVAMGGLGRSF